MLQMKKLSVALALCGVASLNATAHAADIKVGIALDLSGPFSALGAEARDGFELAIEKLGGKLGGQPAEFIRNDFGGNP
ncbi:MAG: ABC transporter substrate-binding protein, partial [Thauera sp.]